MSTLYSPYPPEAVAYSSNGMLVGPGALYAKAMASGQPHRNWLPGWNLLWLSCPDMDLMASGTLNASARSALSVRLSPIGLAVIESIDKRISGALMRDLLLLPRHRAVARLLSRDALALPVAAAVPNWSDNLRTRQLAPDAPNVVFASFKKTRVA